MKFVFVFGVVGFLFFSLLMAYSLRVSKKLWQKYLDPRRYFKTFDAIKDCKLSDDHYWPLRKYEVQVDPIEYAENSYFVPVEVKVLEYSNDGKSAPRKTIEVRVGENAWREYSVTADEFEVAKEKTNDSFHPVNLFCTYDEICSCETIAKIHQKIDIQRNEDEKVKVVKVKPLYCNSFFGKEFFLYRIAAHEYQYLGDRAIVYPDDYKAPSMPTMVHFRQLIGYGIVISFLVIVLFAPAFFDIK